MIYVEWLISFVALGWLITAAVIGIRTRRALPPTWIWIPLLAAGAVRLLRGTAGWMAVVVVVVLVVSERGHLKQKALEGLALIAAILAIGFIFFISDIPTQSGIGGVLVFWISWELKFIPGSDAMTLIACVLLWPNIEFLSAYLIAGLTWSIGVRIKEGGWLRSHIISFPSVIAFSGVLYLGYHLVLLAGSK
jgi:hypothetical protein